jgi:hypothetical protein
MKNTVENKEALHYHTDRWESIALKYIKAGEKNELSHHSMMAIRNRPRVDPCLDFFKETGISYQIRYLVLDLLKVHENDIDWLDVREDRRKKYRGCTDICYSYTTNELIKLFAKIN